MGAVAGVIGGALLGSLGSKKASTSTTIQQSDPWGPVQPHLSDIYGQAANVGNRQYYPGATVAGFGGTTNLAHDLISRKARTIDPLMTGANRSLADTVKGDYLFRNPSMGELGRIGSGRYLQSNPAMRFLESTASGDMLNSNPYLDSMFDQAASRVGDTFRKYTMPGIESSFAAGGRYGSNAMQEAAGTAQQNFGDTLKRLATDIYGGNYARERGFMEDAVGVLGGLHQGERGLQQQALGIQGDIFGRERSLMQQAASFAPEMQAAGYFPLHQLANVGAQQDSMLQRLRDDDVARWDFGQNEARNRISFYNSILQNATPYGTKASSGSTGSNPIMGALSGGLGGAMLGSMFPMPTGGSSIFAPGMASGAGWGTGAAFGNQDYGLFF